MDTEILLGYQLSHKVRYLTQAPLPLRPQLCCTSRMIIQIWAWRKVPLELFHPRNQNTPTGPAPANHRVPHPSSGGISPAVPSPRSNSMIPLIVRELHLPPLGRQEGHRKLSCPATFPCVLG